MNALADPEVGKYFKEHFLASFQKVGTFRIVGKNKQGGNVASYFCAPDGRVLHVVAGPVDAAIYDRKSMSAGLQAAGPAVIESLESTILVPPGWSARMDADGFVILTRAL